MFLYKTAFALALRSRLWSEVTWEKSSGCDDSLLLKATKAGGIHVDSGGNIQSTGLFQSIRKPSIFWKALHIGFIYICIYYNESVFKEMCGF